MNIHKYIYKQVSVCIIGWWVVFTFTICFSLVDYFLSFGVIVFILN